MGIHSHKSSTKFDNFPVIDDACVANVIFLENPHQATLLEKITSKSTFILLLFIKRFAINTQIFLLSRLVIYFCIYFLPVVLCSLQVHAQVMNILN